MDISWLRKRNNESICQTLKTVKFSAQISYSGVQMSETTSENASFLHFYTSTKIVITNYIISIPSSGQKLT